MNADISENKVSYSDVQVNWARWLISWSLELRDTKCRPKGSPPNDSTFAKLANSICKFPEHGPKCEFAAWAFKSLPQPVSKVLFQLFLQHTFATFTFCYTTHSRRSRLVMTPVEFSRLARSHFLQRLLYLS